MKRPDETAMVGAALSAVALAVRSVERRVYARHGFDNDFVRTVVSRSRHDRIELAVRSYRAPSRPRVVLAAMAHVADGEFYERADAALRACDVVLYEGLPFDSEMGRALDAHASKVGYERQSHALPYGDARWRLADLAPEEMLEAFEEALAVKLGARAVRRFWEQVRRGAVETGSTDRPLRLSARGFERLEHVILERRNRIAFEAVRRALAEPGRRSVGVVYGAAHMFEIERQLRRELGYRRTGARWLTAVGNAAWFQYASELAAERAA